MQFVAVNTGGALGRPADFDALCCSFDEWRPGWIAAYISGSDFVHKDLQITDTKCLVERHYPGSGSHAMCWVANAKYRTCFRRTKWQGRAGSIFLQMPDNTSFWLVGAHGAHGDLLDDSLHGAIVVARARPWRSRLLIRET